MFYYRLDFVKWDLDRKERKNMKFIICEKFDKKSWLCCDIKRKPQSFAYILFKCTESIQFLWMMQNELQILIFVLELLIFRCSLDKIYLNKVLVRMVGFVHIKRQNKPHI